MSIHFLEKTNPHARDADILFEEETHVYTIVPDPQSKYTSVTTWVHNQFEKFNSMKVIENMKKGKNWKNSKYYGKSTQEILNMWEANRKESASAGTKLHFDIECFYNGCFNENKSVEYGFFKNFAREYKHLVPYRTEWMVYDSDNKLAGSIDMIFENENGNLEIYDWKRSKEVSKTNNWGKFSCHPQLEHLPDTNYWHYSLQLNIYKFILEKNYGKKVESMYLVVLHPDNKNGNYIRLKVSDLQKEIKNIFV